MPKCKILLSEPFPSHNTIHLILSNARTKYLLLLPVFHETLVEPNFLDRLLEVSESTKAGMVFTDFYEGSKEKKNLSSID
jgi:hypothetical protein